MGEQLLFQKFLEIANVNSVDGIEFAKVKNIGDFEVKVSDIIYGHNNDQMSSVLLKVS